MSRRVLNGFRCLQTSSSSPGARVRLVSACAAPGWDAEMRSIAKFMLQVGKLPPNALTLLFPFLGGERLFSPVQDFSLGKALPAAH